MMASSDLLLKTLLAGQNPELASAMPRMDMAQALMAQGTNAAPAASPWEGLSRVGQALLGGYLYTQGQSDLQDIVGRRAKETEAGLKALGVPEPAPPLPPTPPMPAPPSAATPGATTTSAVAPAEYMPYYQEASKVTGIPVDVLVAQAKQESGFNPNAIGKAGEIGLHQIMPSTARDPGFGMAGVDPATLYDPRSNIMFGAQYLKARGGPRVDFNNPATVDAALKNYNGGGDPNYVANVRRNMGVAARTGGVDVAGPGAPQSPAPAGPQAPPAAPQYSPVAQQAMDTIKRANDVLRLPQFQNNAAVQDAAKRSIEYAKTLMEQDRHTRTEAGTNQRHRETLGQSDRHFNAGSLPAGYQRTPDGGAAPIPGAPQGTLPVGMRPTAAGGAEPIPGVPVKPGESGPFGGNAMEAQANNVLLSIGPKIQAGTATEQERGQYALAYGHLADGRTIFVPDPTDPTGQRQVLARIPGAVPAQFPNPSGAPSAASGGGAAPASPGAPQPIPGTTKPAPPTTEDEKKAAGFAVRMRETGQDLNTLELKGVHSGNPVNAYLEHGGALGRSFQNADYQVYQQRMQDWVRAKLRRESGAVIGKDEMADEIATYFPQPGDGPEKIAAKRRSRELAQAGMETGGGRARIEIPAGAAPATPSREEIEAEMKRRGMK